MKNVLKLSVSSVGLFVCFNYTNVHADAIKVTINNDSRIYDQEPIMKDNRVFIPIRGIAEDTGATVLYSNAEKKGNH